MTTDVAQIFSAFCFFVVGQFHCSSFIVVNRSFFSVSFVCVQITTIDFIPRFKIFSGGPLDFPRVWQCFARLPREALKVGMEWVIQIPRLLNDDVRVLR